MTEKELFAKTAASDYPVCFAVQCPRREHCLRWKVGQEMTESRSFISTVNPRAHDVGTAECPQYRHAEKVRFAKGMMHIFSDDMPRRIEKAVRQEFTEHHCKTYYYEYRNGQRLISLALQDEIRDLFRKAGWEKEIEFDGYVEDYDW